MSYRDRPKWLTVGRWQPVFPGYVRLLLLRYVVKHVVYFKALKLTFSSTGMSHRLILNMFTLCLYIWIHHTPPSDRR